MYKGKEPVGKWIVPWGQGLQYFDYDFEMVYQKECNSGSDTLFVLPMGHQPLQDLEEIGYQAPVPTLLPHQLIRKMVTPPIARQDSAKGKVIVGFRIEKDGSITDFHVVQRVHPALDKEALRLIKQLTFISPAMVKNKQVAICAIQGFNFRATN
jgi:TonB family protein